jgi:hypothetical protein
MAPRKKRSRITERDESFTRVLQVAREGAAESAFASRSEDVAPKVENPDRPPAPESVPVDFAPSAEAAPGEGNEVREPALSNPDASADGSREKAGASEEMVTIRIAFRVRADLVARAEAWGRTARCPARTILRTALRDLQPVLFEELPGLDYRDISHARQIDVAARLDTTLTIAAELRDALQARLDPEGFNGLSPLLSRWMRDRFSAHCDAWLREAGY